MSVGCTWLNSLISHRTETQTLLLSKNSPKTCLSCFQPHVRSLRGAATHSELSYITVKNTRTWRLCLVHQHTVPQGLSKADCAAGAFSRTSEGGSHSHRKSTVIPVCMCRHNFNSQQAAHNSSADEWLPFSFSALSGAISTLVYCIALLY